MSSATKRPSSHEPIYPPKKRALYKHQQEIEDKENSGVIHQSHAGRQQEQWRKSNNGFSFLRESLTNIHDGVLSNQSLLDGRHFHPAYQKEFTRPRSDSLHSVHSQYSDLSDTTVSMASRESSPYTVSGVNDMRTPERTPLSALATVGSNISKPLFPASDSESCHSDSPSPESATPTSHRHGNRTGLDHVVIQDAIGNSMRNVLQREWDHPNVNNIKMGKNDEVNGIINFKQYNPMNEFSLTHSTSVGLNVTALREVDQSEVNRLQINQSNGRKVNISQSESSKVPSAGGSVKPMLSLMEKFNEEAMKKNSVSNINMNLSSSEELVIRDMSNLSSGGMKYNCSICGLEFGQRSELGVHMKKTHDSQRGKCRLCFIDFGNAEKLNQHMKSDHLGVNPYKCEHCDREFSQYNNLRRHMRVHRDKIFKCNLCDREFNEEFYLTMHMGTHTGKRVYSCGVCNACFPSNHELKQHVKTHAPSELHTCDICNKSFSKACVLRQHKKGHTGERPHKCEKCMKTFIHRHHLTMHMRSHTDSKPYTCEICSKEFYQSSHLYKHMRSHEEGETVQDAVRGPLDTGNNGINTPGCTNTSKVPTTLDVKEKILDKLRSDRIKVSEPQASLNIKTSLPESAKGDYLGIVAELPKENTEVNFRTNEESSKHPFYLVKKPLNNSTADVRCDLSLTKQHSVNQLTYLPVNDNSISSKCNAEGGMLKMNSDTSYARGKSPDRGYRDKDHRNTAVRTKTRHEISPNRLTSHLPNHLTRTEQRKHDEVQNRYEVRPNFDMQNQWSNASNLYNLPYINRYPLPGNLPPGFPVSGHPGDISTGMDGAMFRQHYDNGASYPHPLLNHTASSSNPLYMAYNTHLQSYLHHMYMINPSLLAHSPSYLHGNPYFPSNIASPNNHLLYGSQPQRPMASQSSEQSTMNPLSKKSCSNGRRLLSVKTEKVPEINEQRDSKKINRENCESDEHETHTDLVNNFCRKVNEVVEKSKKIRENPREKLREKDICVDDVRDDTFVGESDTKTEVAEELLKLSERFTNKCRQDIAAGAALLTEGGSDGRIVPDYVYQSRSETPRKESEQKMAMDLSLKCESKEIGIGESFSDMVKEMDSAKYVSNGAAYVDGRSEEIGSVQMDDVDKIGDDIVQDKFKGDVEEMGAQNMDYDDSLEEHRLEIDMGEEEAEYVKENGRSDKEDVEEDRSEVEEQKEEMLKNTVIEEKSDTDEHVVKNCDAGGTGRCDFNDADCDKKGKANPYTHVAVSRHGWHEALAGNIPDSLVNVSNVPSKLKTTGTAESPLGSGEYKMTTHTEDKYKKCEIYGDSIPRSDLIKHMDKHTEEISTKVNSKVESNFICCVCFENFNSSESLEQHQVVHLQSEPVRYLCRLCGQSFALPNDLQCHMMLKHRCNKGTPDKGIKRSLSRLGSEAGNGNGKPGENFKHWMDGLNGDNREGDKFKKAGVENVNITYKDREILVMGKKSFVENSICDNVESCFRSKKSEGENKISLPENRVIENENQTSEFLVQTVGRLNSVKSVSYMENTDKAAKVRDDESFECNVCGEYFEVVDMFEDHMKLHGVGKPYKCDMCGRGFSHRHNLTRHKMSHNTKNFTCTICSRTFKEQFYLQMHMKTHTEDKCKTCEICGESILRSDLIKHMDKHMGEISTNPTYAQIGSRVKEIRTFGECGSRKNGVVKDNCIVGDPNHRSSEAIRSKVLSDVSRRHENLENKSPRKPSKQAFRQLENLDFASNVR